MMRMLSAVFIIAVLTSAIALFLLDAKLILAQLLLFLCLFYVNIFNVDFLFLLVGAFQLIMAWVVLYKSKKAIDYDYNLVLEKTHKAPRNLTKGGNLGGDFSLFRKNY